MRTQVIGATAIVAAGFGMAGMALACGDKLVALGGGVSFERIVVSRNPGHIMLLLEPATGLTAANEKYNFAASLSLAGHEVFIVRSADELRAQRAAAKPDLILVDTTRDGEFQFEGTTGRAAPVVMPVVYSTQGILPTSADQNAGCTTFASGRKGADLLRAVEQALKLRSRGMPSPCQKGVASQQA